MSKPIVCHAGCGGHVVIIKGVLVCSVCERRIADPMELAPRGTGHQPEPETSTEWDWVAQ